MPKWLTANFGLKILSVFIAILLWFHIITERSYQAVFNVPIYITNISKNLVLTQFPPPTAKVKLKARGKELIRLKFGEQLKIVCDFSGASKGWRRIDLTNDNVVVPYRAKITVVDVFNPSDFVVRLDKKNKKTVNVIPIFSGPLKVKVMPKTLEIYGSKDDIQQITQVTTEEISIKRLTGLPETLKVKINVPERIEVSQDSVSVVISRE